MPDFNGGEEPKEGGRMILGACRAPCFQGFGWCENRPSLTIFSSFYLFNFCLCLTSYTLVLLSSPSLVLSLSHPSCWMSPKMNE